LQYFAFNLLALVYVVTVFISAIANGFPEVPETIFGLTGAAALAYTTKKAADRAVPTITSVSPRRVRTGDVLDIFGQNLVVGAGTVPRVEVDGRPVASVEVVKDDALRITGAGNDHLRITLPVLSGNDTAQLVVTPEGGRPTAPMELEVDRGAIANVEPQPLQLGRDSRLLIRGTGLTQTGATPQVMLGQAALTLEGTPQSDLVIATVQPNQFDQIETGSAVRLTVLVGNVSFSRLVQVDAPTITGVTPTPIARDVSKPVEIAGSALDGRPCTVHLGDHELDVTSQGATKVVARLRAGDLSSYADGDLVVTVGGFEAKRPVTIAP
jgi:hypothetical protein